MSEDHLDEYEHYNYEQDKLVAGGHSGKQRTKKEAQLHSNHPDPCGTRKPVEKLMNNQARERDKVLRELAGEEEEEGKKEDVFRAKHQSGPEKSRKQRRSRTKST